jgi:Fe-S-cluster containining protein
MSLRDAFTRTVCACDRCSRFCKFIPGVLAPGDPELIAAHLGITSAEVNEKLLASPGALVMNRLTRQTGRVPTIVPDRDANGVCVFLDQGTGLCTIHPFAPFGCAYIDDHMSPEEGDKRSMALLVNVVRDPLYMARWQRLWNAGRRAPGPETLRAKDSMEQKRR